MRTSDSRPLSARRQRPFVIGLWISANLILPFLCAQVLPPLSASAVGTAISLGLLANAYACWRLSDDGMSPLPRAARCALLLMVSVSFGTFSGVSGCATPSHGGRHPWYGH